MGFFGAVGINPFLGNMSYKPTKLYVKGAFLGFRR